MCTDCQLYIVKWLGALIEYCVMYPILCVSQWNIFWQKTANQNVFFNSCQNSKKVLYLHVLTSTGFLKAWLEHNSKQNFEIWLSWNGIDLVKNKYHCSAGKSNLYGLLTSKAGSKRIWCLMPIGTNSQTIGTHKIQYLQQKCTSNK